MCILYRSYPFSKAWFSLLSVASGSPAIAALRLAVSTVSGKMPSEDVCSLHCCISLQKKGRRKLEGDMSPFFLDSHITYTWHCPNKMMVSPMDSPDISVMKPLWRSSHKKEQECPWSICSALHSILTHIVHTESFTSQTNLPQLEIIANSLGRVAAQICSIPSGRKWD